MWWIIFILIDIGLTGLPKLVGGEGGTPPPCPSVPTALSRRRGVTLFSNGILIDIAARHDLEPTASPLQQKLHFDLRMSFQKLESQPF